MNQQRALFRLAMALEGLPVLGCIEGRTAAEAGIRYGDILLIVNGRRTRTFADYVEAKELREDGMRVVLFRDGKEQTVELVFGDEPPAAATRLAELAGGPLAALAPSALDPYGEN
jgi:hypothetical protein